MRERVKSENPHPGPVDRADRDSGVCREAAAHGRAALQNRHEPSHSGNAFRAGCGVDVRTRESVR